MEIEEVTPEIYYSFIKSPTHLFNAATFSDLNKSKCETEFYLK